MDNNGRIMSLYSRSITGAIDDIYHRNHKTTAPNPNQYNVSTLHSADLEVSIGCELYPPAIQAPCGEVRFIFEFLRSTQNHKPLSCREKHFYIFFLEAVSF